MALSYTSAIAALLNNGNGKQVLPISMANLIELSKDKTSFGNSAQSVQDALSYLAGSFEYANNAASTAETNAKKYTDDKIGELDVAYVGSATKEGHEKYISYIWEKDGKIEAFAQDMIAANVAYNGGDSRANVADELAHINATIANNLKATTLKLVKVNGVYEHPASTVSADGTEYRLKQGENTVASFNIEKDSFVKSGAVVRCKIDSYGNIINSDSDGNIIEDYKGEDGKYFIKLEIKTSNDTGEDPAEKTLYIPAESLVDVYTANNGVDGANSVTITVDQEHNTISAVIKAGGVGTNELADSAVTAAKIANDAVETDKIADANVTTAKIANSAVTTEKIATNAVTTAKIADNAVETAKINALAVTTEKINALAVTTEKINALAVTTEKIADKNVTLVKLADDVQASLGKADSAVQKITEGSTAGAIDVDGTAVPIHGLATVATTGAAKNVTIDAITELDALTALGAGQHVDDVQEALATLAGKVKAINNGAVTSVKASVVDNGKDTQNAVTILMTPVAESKGAVEVQLTHNLGSAAALDYDATTSATPVSQAFWDALAK